ncbi:MAG TPA: NAD(P) transhydrogenase subunit alpha [Flavobacteriaceae bacterium]|nr:NAD(P) transhydrogenase subunit alpha [Flavobacteriaceae bacterium]
MTDQPVRGSLGVLKTDRDPRVCLLPKETKRLVAELKWNVLIQEDLGESLGISDAEYREAGATITSKEDILKNADVIISIDHTYGGEDIRPGVHFIGIFNPLFYRDRLEIYKNHALTVTSLDLLPRTTLAQSMDVLSSMASLAGYRAVIKAANLFNGILPMFTTAAGTITPAKTLILGAGVAGLQAIATARRLGAVVEAFDVRSAAGEEVRSLGASFIEVEGHTESQSAGGYAVEQSEEYQRKQKELIHKHISSADIVISTANIPGRKAPVLIENRSVDAMKPGSVIIDLAAEQGGNCTLSRNNETIYHQGITIVGNSNLAAEIPSAASKLLSNNFFSFMKHMAKAKENDPLIEGSRIMTDGVFTHPRFTEPQNN